MDNRSKQISTVTYMVASVVFFLTGFLGDTSGGPAFVVLGIAFFVLALNTWSPRSERNEM